MACRPCTPPVRPSALHHAVEILEGKLLRGGLAGCQVSKGVLRNGIMHKRIVCLLAGHDVLPHLPAVHPGAPLQHLHQNPLREVRLSPPAPAFRFSYPIPFVASSALPLFALLRPPAARLKHCCPNPTPPPPPPSFPQPSSELATHLGYLVTDCRVRLQVLPDPLRVPADGLCAGGGGGILLRRPVPRVPQRLQLPGLRRCCGASSWRHLSSTSMDMSALCIAA